MENATFMKWDSKFLIYCLEWTPSLNFKQHSI